MVIKSPFRIGLWDPFQMAELTPWLINGGGGVHPNHLTGMILQAIEAQAALQDLLEASEARTWCWRNPGFR